MSNKQTRRAVVLAVAGLLATQAVGQTGPAGVVAENPDSVAVAQKRSSGIMEELKLTDAAQAAHVKQGIEDFIVTLKNLHEGKTPPVGDAKKAALADARTKLYAMLDAEKLTDDQKLIVKNGLVANHYRINYDAFLFLVPDLKPEEKQQIHDILSDAFDDAIVLNSGTAKGQAFEKRRGRVNAYLSKQGYDLKALSKVRNEKLQQRKVKPADAATKPAG